MLRTKFFDPQRLTLLKLLPLDLIDRVEAPPPCLEFKPWHVRMCVFCV